MPHTTSTSTASPQRLWSFVGDVSRWAEYLPTVNTVQPLDPDSAIGVGARFTVRLVGLPKAIYEITDWRPGRGFTWVATTPGVTTTATHEVTPTDAGSQLHLGLAWSGPLSGLAQFALQNKAARMVQSEADTFAKLAAGD